MRRLFIADVHANLPAFEAVLEDAGAVDEVVFVGDIVGFGPHPCQCVDLLEELGALAISGNHDLGVLEVSGKSEGPGEPGEWVQWTARQLTQGQLAYLGRLPERRIICADSGPIHMLHHPPGAPYIHPAMPDELIARHCRTAPGRFVIFGHSHRLIDRSVQGRRFVFMPPVGQPRDGDPRAGYALQSAREMSFHRVEYDVEAVIADIRSIGLDPDFTDRWVQFVRTGFDEEWSRPYSPV